MMRGAQQPTIFYLTCTGTPDGRVLSRSGWATRCSRPRRKSHPALIVTAGAGLNFRYEGGHSELCSLMGCLLIPFPHPRFFLDRSCHSSCITWTWRKSSEKGWKRLSTGAQWPFTHAHSRASQIGRKRVFADLDIPPRVPSQRSLIQFGHNRNSATPLLL